MSQYLIITWRVLHLYHDKGVDSVELVDCYLCTTLTLNSGENVSVCFCNHLWYCTVPNLNINAWLNEIAFLGNALQLAVLSFTLVKLSTFYVWATA